MVAQSNSATVKCRTPTILAVAVATTLSVALATPLIYPLLSAQAGTGESTSISRCGVKFADIVDSVRPSVVNISTTRNHATTVDRHPNAESRPFGEHFKHKFRGYGDPRQRSMAEGSGFIVSAEGQVVTNHHVVAGAATITVTLNDGTALPARLLGSDPRTDLALLQIEPEEPLPFVEFGDSESVRAGDWVLAIGNPFGLGGSVTAGIVSARGRDIHAGPYDDFIQVDAPINQGNSGGPLFDTCGQVIGINTAIFSPNGGSVGIGFAIPASLAAAVITQLDSNGVVERGWLGVQIQPLTEQIASNLDLETAAGALIVSVFPDSPAAGVGLEPGDVILAGNGHDIDAPRDLSRLVASLAPHSTLELSIWHRGRQRHLDVEIGQLVSEPLAAQLEPPAQAEPTAGIGLSLAPLSPENRTRFGVADDATGSIVVAVKPLSPAAAQQLRPGDIIVQVGHVPVSGPADVLAALDRAVKAKREAVLLLVVRSGRARFVAVPLA
jgi:serine protease Do